MNKHRRHLRPGFTLLEVMIVIVILLALATFVGISLLGTKDKATKGTVGLQLNSIKEAMKHFRIDFDRFPTDEEGVRVLWSKEALSSDSPAEKWHAYMDEPVPKDTWGSAWGYKQAGEKGPTGYFDLWSFGPDKQDGTEDDIHLWAPKTDEDSSGGSPTSTNSPSSGTGSGNSGGN